MSMRHRFHAVYKGLFAASTLSGFLSLLTHPASAQTTPACGVLRSHAQPLAFDIASIRPSHANESFNERVVPDGFLLEDGSLRMLIRLAYDPEEFVGDKDLVNAPRWVSQEYFNILAKVAPEDSARWQRDTSMDPDSPVFKCALQQLLVERCGLKLHLIPGMTDGFALVLSRTGIQKGLQPAKKAAPGNAAAPSTQSSQTPVSLGGIVMGVRFQRQPLSKLAHFLSGLSSFVIEDHTGLTGEYDFSIRDNMPVHANAQEREDYRLPSERWDLQSLGLRLVPAKVHTTLLVVDHIERPSPN
jgi:uncharacterized protein (TIGR03435 family)